MTLASPDLFTEALVDPTRLAVRPAPEEERRLERGLAMLIDGRFADYQRTGEQVGWPPFGQAPTPDATPGERVLSSLSLQLSGASSAAGILAGVVRNPEAPANVRLVAAILGAVAFRDAGRPEMTLQMLSDPGIDLPYARPFLLLHLSVSQRELGHPSTALDTALAAEKSLGRRARTTVLGEALAAVLHRNVSAFAFAAGRKDVALARQRMPRARVLDRIEARVESGLSSWLEQEFEGRLEDPTQSTMTFRQEDPVQMPLIAALLRAEVLGDWYLTREARKRLGRYQLLASVGQEDRQPVPALHQLRRANDSKAIRQALRWYRTEGPLPPIQQFGISLTSTPWTQLTLQADLVAVAESADLMTEAAAEVALARTQSTLEELLAGLPTARLEGEVINALAALLQVTPRGHAQTAEKFIDIVEGSNDPLLLHSVTRLLDRLDWEQVPRETLERWIAYCQTNLIGVSEHRFAAASLLRALPRRESVHRAALDAFRRQPDLLTAANALVVGPVPITWAISIAKLARDQLHHIRAEAAKGSHGYGEFVQAPLLLTHLLMEYRGVPGWRDLLGFLFDANIAPSKKVGPLTEILGRPDLVPANVHGRLTRWVKGPVQYNQIPMDTLEEFQAVVLGLRLRYRTKSEQALVADLLDMATNASRSARRQAARLLPVAVGRIERSTLVTLALTLSRDAASDVRGASGSALAKLAGESDDPLDKLSWQRIAAMLRDPGALVPQAVLGGLGQRSSQTPSKELLRVIHDLAREHPSTTVRRAAVRVIDLSREPTTSRAAPRPLA